MNTVTHDKVIIGDLILPEQILADGAIVIRDGIIADVGPVKSILAGVDDLVARIDVPDGYISPGFVDLHVHGGGGADFMDGTPAAFRTVLSAHARHGTTSIVPTTTVARHEQLLAMLDLCRRFHGERPAGGSRVLGAHFYGPYFAFTERGCHPGGPVRAPEAREFAAYLTYVDSIVTATVAPELDGAEAFVRACQAAGIRSNVGHSAATFDQMAAAVEWGVRHVDHLFCAMSDKTKLRREQAYPMRGGVLEATLYFDELTTEVITDGKHLAPELLNLALKIKGPDRLALVTDCNRALDMPEGRYLFGPTDGGEPFDHRDGVGVMPDGQSLASGASGMDHMVRTAFAQSERPLWEVVRMASLTPARIAGCEKEVGSIETGKRADLLILDRDLAVQRVFIDGEEL